MTEETKTEFKTFNPKMVLIEPSQIMAICELPENFINEYPSYNYKEVSGKDFLFKNNAKGKPEYRLINQEDNTKFKEEYVKSALKIVDALNLDNDLRFFYAIQRPLILFIDNQAKQISLMVAPCIDMD